MHRGNKMKSYSEYQAQAGTEPNVPAPIIEWLAYKDGQCCVFSSECTAKDFSKLIERRVRNQNEIDAARGRVNQFRQDAYNFWYTALREEYMTLNAEVFGLCYNKAESLCDGGSLDSTAAYMSEMVGFFLEASKLNMLPYTK